LNECWEEYARFPRHELARRIGTKQPAIARIEAAKSNVGLDTIQAIAIALDAGIAISLRPAEGEAG
jgi:transcriptional regulator with XRE-family HTH domain